MATLEQIEQVMSLLDQAQPAAIFKWIDASKAGIGAVLRLLSCSEQPATAGEIAEYIGVSTPRVTVLLKKMTTQGLILRETDAEDARIARIRLSERGKELSQEQKAALYRDMGEVIDRVGPEQLMEFLALSKEIYNAMTEVLSCHTESDFPLRQ